MGISSRGWLALIFSLITAASSQAIEYSLPDGSTLRLEQIQYGKWEQWKLAGPWEELKEKANRFRLERKYGPLPKSGGSSTWASDYLAHTNEAALHLWITRRYPNAVGPGGMPKLQRVNVESIRFVDGDGCIFPATQRGGGIEQLLSSKLQLSEEIEVNWFTFEAFPRHEKELRLRIYEYTGNRKLLAEILVPNPAPLPKKPAWQAEPLPRSKAQGNTTFILKDVTIKTNFSYLKPKERAFEHPLEIVPELEVLDNGKPTQHRDALDMELFDSSGNFAAKDQKNSLFLCPKETAWKLRVRYFGEETSHAALGSNWTIPGVKIPPPGEFVILNATNKLEGVSIKAIALTGAGQVMYKRNTPVNASVIAPPLHRNSKSTTYYSGWGPHNTDYNLKTTNAAHLALELSGMTHNQRLTVHATDDQGRKFYAYPYDWSWGRPSGINYIYQRDSTEPLFLFLDLPEDSKTADLTFSLHVPQIVEFNFKPPVSKQSLSQ